MKKCIIKNCPALKTCDCVNTFCIYKKILAKPRDRMLYIKNKLSSCLGYSEEQKKIRYEELDWVIKEFINLVEIEVSDGNYELV